MSCKMRNKIIYFSVSDSDGNEHLGLKVCYNQMQAWRPLHLNEVAGATSENIAGGLFPASERAGEKYDTGGMMWLP